MASPRVLGLPPPHHQPALLPGTGERSPVPDLGRKERAGQAWKPRRDFSGVLGEPAETTTPGAPGDLGRGSTSCFVLETLVLQFYSPHGLGQPNLQALYGAWEKSRGAALTPPKLRGIGNLKIQGQVLF